MLSLALVAVVVALVLEVPLSARARMVKPEVLALAPEYGSTIFQPSRLWEVIASSRVRFAVLLVTPPPQVASLVGPVRRLAWAQAICSVIALAALVAYIEA
jgi:hypothetical protein